jgi:hypothetical protein
MRLNTEVSTTMLRHTTFTISTGLLSLLALAAPAHAQFDGWMRNRPGYDQDYRRSYYDAQRIAYDNGYREGLEQGEKAARDRRAFDPEREKDFRKADEGYDRGYGDKDRYRETFRSGFVAGYREGYDNFSSRYGYGRDTSRGDRGWGYGYPGTYGNNRIPGYGGTYGYGRYGTYGNIAYQNGVNDGYEKGVDDARDGESPDPRRSKWYRGGDRHYDSRYGSKDAYRNEYRAGFQDGYQRGYREGRRY